MASSIKFFFVKPVLSVRRGEICAFVFELGPTDLEDSIHIEECVFDAKNNYVHISKHLMSRNGDVC